MKMSEKFKVKEVGKLFLCGSNLAKLRSKYSNGETRFFTMKKVLDFAAIWKKMRFLESAQLLRLRISSRMKGIGIAVIFVVLIVSASPVPNYTPAKSALLYDREGQVLSGVISAEEQWCFSLDEALPPRFISSLLLFEDEYFYFHPGINPISMLKALVLNLRQGRVVRGGSTLTMQLMRMKNKNAERTYFNKLLECWGALKYSLWYSKRRILTEWAEVAPFGGNTIGLKAASLRYFNKSPENLSWAEYALLAVMPHTPSSAHLGKNREKLQSYRNFLLRKLHKRGHFSAQDLALYLSEELPEPVHNIPQEAYHLLHFLQSKHPGQHIFRSTIDGVLQRHVQHLLDVERIHLQMDGIETAAAIVVDLQTNELVVYCGNAQDSQTDFRYVDMVQAMRSYGSLLKPFLYAHALEQGLFLPGELIADVPIAFGDFRPRNFDRRFRGAARLDDILIQSLNVPAVRLLQECGMESFYQLLRKLDLEGVDKGAGHYGLSIILGGAETSMWELMRLYKGLAQNLAGDPSPYRDVKVLQNQEDKLRSAYSFSNYSLRHTVKAMADVSRPREEKHWKVYSGSKKVAWKTGTSYGHRDAWSIGFNGKYAVAVWVGNEKGEGRHQLTGIARAAPLMFRIFQILPDHPWVNTKQEVNSKSVSLRVCKTSGKLAGTLCRDTELLSVHRVNHAMRSCSYHQKVFLNGMGKMVAPECTELIESEDHVFVLPSAMDYYYRQHNASYKGLPEADPNCPPVQSRLAIVYPESGMKLHLPRNSNEHYNRLIAIANCADPDISLFWFLDDKFIATSSKQGLHQCEYLIPPGAHKLTVADELGNQAEVQVQVLH